MKFSPPSAMLFIMEEKGAAKPRASSFFTFYNHSPLWHFGGFDGFCNPKPQAMLFLNFSNEYVNSFKSKYREVAESFKRNDIIFLISDVDGSQSVFQYLGLKEGQAPFIFIQEQDANKYLKAKLEEITTWVKEYTARCVFLFLFLVGEEFTDFIIGLRNINAIRTFSRDAHLSVGAGVSVTALIVGRSIVADFRLVMEFMLVVIHIARVKESSASETHLPSTCLIKNLRQKMVAIGRINRVVVSSDETYNIILDIVYEPQEICTTEMRSSEMLVLETLLVGQKDLLNLREFDVSL